MQKLIFIFILLCTQWLLVSCSDGIDSASKLIFNDTNILHLEITPSQLRLPIGVTEPVEATAIYRNGEFEDVTDKVRWTVEDQSLFDLDTMGPRQKAIRTLLPGRTMLTAHYEGLTATVPVEISAAELVSIQVTPGIASVAAGLPLNFSVTGVYDDGSFEDLTEAATWSSSQTSRATVSNIPGLKGRALSTNPGATTIRAVVGDFSDSVVLNVTSAVLSSLQITPLNFNLVRGLFHQFHASGTFSDNSTSDLTNLVTWSSTDPLVLSVGGQTGVVTGLSAGSTSVVASFGSVTAQAMVTIVAPTLQTLTITPGNANARLGSALRFTATGVYDDLSVQDLTQLVLWSSSNPSVVTVSNASGFHGHSSLLQPGSVTLTASYGGVQGQTHFTVTNAVLETIRITPGDTISPLGITQAFEALGTYSDGRVENITNLVTWASSDLSIASVSNSGINHGVASPLSVGACEISATLDGVTEAVDYDVISATLLAMDIFPQGSSVPAGLSRQMTANGHFSDGRTVDITQFVTWSSSQPGTADVGNLSPQKGVLQGLSVGFVTVTASYQGLSRSTSFEVTAAQLVSIGIFPASQSVVLGHDHPFTALGTYTDGSVLDVTGSATWMTDSLSTGTVSNASGHRGLLTSEAEGNLTLSATLSGVTGAAQVTVTPPELVSLALVPPQLTLALGLGSQLKVMGTYTNGSIRELTLSASWGVSDSSVASVAAGMVTSLARGSSEINVNVGSLQVSGNLTVGNPNLVSIALSPLNSQLPLGLTKQLSAQGTFSDGSTQDITGSVSWSTGASSLATISGTGLVSSVALGSTTVLASMGTVTASTSITVTNPDLVSLSVTPSSSSVALGLTKQLTATGTYTDGSTKDISSTVNWSTSDASVSEVSSTGLVSTLAQGSVTVTVSFGSLSSSANLVVSQATLVSMTITPGSLGLALGLSQQLTATGTYTDASTRDITADVSWSTSNPSSTNVSITGLLTTLAQGSSTIGASLSGVSALALVTVGAPTLSALSFSPSGLSLATGVSQQMSAIGTFTDGSTQNLTNGVQWASGNSAVVSVTSTGLVTGLSVGSTSITITKNSVSASTSVVVSAANLVSLSLTPLSPSVALGLAKQFSASGTYSDGSTQNLTNVVTWSSGSASVASIAAGGLASTLTQGTTLIQASLNGVSASTLLTVTAPELVSVAVTPGNSSVALGLTKQFVATGTYTDNSVRDLSATTTWALGNLAVGSISSAGLVSTLTQGSTSVSATTGGIVGQTTLNVSSPGLVSIAVNPTNSSIALGLTQQFTALGTYTNNSTQDITLAVTWSVGNSSIATMIGNGLASSATAGTTSVSAALNGVTGTTGFTVTPPTLVSIAVTPGSASVALGLTKQFMATGTYTDGSTQNLSSAVSWSSALTSFATVSATGLATSVSEGNTVISATLNSVTGTGTLAVSPKELVSLALSPNNASVALGLTQQFMATGTYTDGTAANVSSSVAWVTANASIGTVSSSGLFTSLAQGTTSVTASLTGISGSASVTVTAAKLVSIALSPVNPSIALGLTQQFTATGTYTNGSTANISSSVTWASSSGSVGTISFSGLLTGQGVGTTTISAAQGSVSTSTSITITSPELVSIAVTPANSSVSLGLTKQMLATGTYTNGSTQNLTGSVSWSVTQSSSASVSSTGLVSTLATGSTGVSAALNGIVGSTQLTINPPALVSIAITPAASSVALGLNQQMTATGTYTNGSTLDLTMSAVWASSQDTVAAHLGQGLMTTLSQGVTTVSASLSGVTGSTQLTVNPATLVSIAVTPANSSAALGLTKQMIATGTYTNGSTQNLSSIVSWVAGSPSVAGVSSSGLVSTLATGSTSVSASLNGVTGSTQFTVNPASLVSIAVTPANSSVALGLTKQMVATGTYTDGTTQNLTSTASWTTGSGSVASVSSVGLVSTIGTGTTSVLATVSGVTGTTNINVTAPALVSIAVTPTNSSVALGLTKQFTATGTYTNGSTQDVTASATWASGTQAVSTISNSGLASSASQGSTVVSATIGSVSGSTNFTVTAPALVSIAVTPANSSVALGLTKQLTATGTYTNGTTQNLTSTVSWSSGLSSVATISSSGLATSVAQGTSVISAVLSGVTGSTNFTVSAPALVSIAVTPASSSVALGLTKQMVATGTYTDGSTQNISSSVSWSSSSTAVGTVSTSGLVSTLTQGTSTITASLSGISGFTDLTVTAPVLVSITITPGNPSMAVLSVIQFTATGNYTNGSTQNLTSTVAWSSSSALVSFSAFQAGRATILNAGTTTIKATLGAIVGQTTVSGL